MKSAPFYALAAFLVGCGTAGSTWQRSELFFGQTTTNGAAISAAQWNDFVQTNIARRFPDGFTVFTSEGHWRDAKQVVHTEPVKFLLILHPRSARDDAQITALAEDYLRDFHQESVLLDSARSTVKFFDHVNK